MLIDLHTHSFLSDGALIPSELVRRYIVAGFDAVAITDHADSSNIDNIIKSLVRVCYELNKYWPIKAIPGIELTHIPLQQFLPLTKYARKKGAKIVVAHGESPVEPVLKGTNNSAIKARVDILVHPGYISEADVLLSKKNNVLLEITTRTGHCKGNSHVAKLAKKFNAPLVIDSDFHMPRDIPSRALFEKIAKAAGLSSADLAQIDKNKERLLSSLRASPPQADERGNHKPKQ
jgi:putative hydrolase